MIQDDSPNSRARDLIMRELMPINSCVKPSCRLPATAATI